MLYPSVPLIRFKRSFRAGGTSGVIRRRNGGRKIHDAEITGGQEARKGEFPWIALLGKKLSNGEREISRKSSLLERILQYLNILARAKLGLKG